MPQQAQETSLNDIAHMLSLDAGQLRAQFADIRPMAHQLHLQKGLQCGEAWREALAAISRSPKVAKLDPTEVLRKALARFIGWNFSTSHVDRSFSKQLGFSRFPQRGDVSKERINDEAQVLDIATFPLEDQKFVVLAARRMWARLYGMPRKHTNQRSDTGKKAANLSQSEAAWKRQRRADVDEQLQQHDLSKAASLEARIVGQGGWEDSHEKEKQFQLSKRHARLLEAIEDKSLDPASLDKGTLTSFQTYLETEEAKAAKKQAPKAPKADVWQRPAMPNLANKKFYTGNMKSAELVAALRKLHLLSVQSVFEADVLVTKDVCAPEIQHLFPIMLAGKLVCNGNVLYLTTGGKQGDSLQYVKQVKTKRFVYISPAFARDHGQLAVQILYHCKSGRSTHFPGTQWRHLGTPEELNNRWAACVRLQRQTEVFVFCTEQEKDDFQHFKKTFSAADAFSELGIVDRKLSAAGPSVANAPLWLVSG